MFIEILHNAKDLWEILPQLSICNVQFCWKKRTDRWLSEKRNWSVWHHFKETTSSWLVSSIGKVLHRYRRGQGFESRTNLNFFRLSFRNCKSCVYNCDDLFSYNKLPKVAENASLQSPDYGRVLRCLTRNNTLALGQQIARWTHWTCESMSPPWPAIGKQRECLFFLTLIASRSSVNVSSTRTIYSNRKNQAFQE